MATGRLSLLARAVLGPRRTRRLAVVHAIDDLADSLITLSLVGSLFFNVSLEASRSRIILYLLLTAVPLTLVAPVVGPVLDRLKAGYGTVVVGSLVVRAGCALALAGSLLSLAFYPLVFGILLMRKAYALAKTAMLANLLPDSQELVDASGHIARTGTIAGGIGTALGGAIIGLAGVEWLPVAAAGGYVVGAVVAQSIRVNPTAGSVQGAVVRAETPAEVRRAVGAVFFIRAAAGALTFLLALTIKRGGGDAWIFAFALVSAGVGSFLGTVIVPWLTARVSPTRAVALTLFVPGLVTSFGVLTVGNIAMIVIAFAIGLGSSVSSRLMDALYGRAPEHIRGRVISRSELAFQIATVAGATIAVWAYPGPRVGFAVVGVALLLAGSTYASRLQLSLRREAGMFLIGRSGGGGDELPRTLLAEAVRYAELGQHAVAVIVADSAVRAADRQMPARPPEPAVEANWLILTGVIDAVSSGATEATADLAVAVIAGAEAMLDRPPDVPAEVVTSGASPSRRGRRRRTTGSPASGA